MITQPAKVIQISDHYCVVDTIPKSACPRCAEGKGCGGGILAQAFANKTYQLKVSFSADLENDDFTIPAVGNQVLIAMSSNGLLLASLVMYFLPLFFMLLSAIGVSIWVSAEDIYTVVAAMIGLGIGALMASKLSQLLIHAGVTQPHFVELSKSNCWYPAS